jgi:hypothetical protein
MINLQDYLKVSLLLNLLLLTSSCALPKVYRATIGISNNDSKFKTTSNSGTTRELCVESVNDGVSDADKCATGNGYKSDKGLGFWDPWLEFEPSFIGSSNFGTSYFFSFNKSNTTLLDYPIIGEKSDIQIDRVSLNPQFFYSFGDKFITSGKGLSFKLGVGVALNYISKFQVTRKSTDEVFSSDTKFKPGYSAFIELNWNWFIFRVENSQVDYEDKKFDGIEKDTLRIENNKGSMYYAYYF